jgi:hypothetical protein
MSIDPAFFATPTLQTAVISATAYAGSRTAPTGLTSIYTAEDSDTNDKATAIRRIDFKSLGTSVAGQLELWLYDGTTYSLLPTYGMPTIVAVTGSTTLAPWEASLILPLDRPLILPAAATPWSIHAGVSVTQTTAIKAITYGATT